MLSERMSRRSEGKQPTKLVTAGALAACVLSAGIAQSGLAQERIRVESPGPVNPWTTTAFSRDTSSLRFVIFCDRAGDLRPGVFEQAVAKANLLKPDLAVCVGDLIVGCEDSAEVEREWDELDAIVRNLEMPFFYVPGNHDYGSGVQARVWARRRGQSYYHFLYRNVLFLCLNTEDGSRSGRIGQEQRDYFRGVLAKNAGVGWTIVLMHEPLWTANDTSGANGWRDMEAMLGARQYTVFAGHLHAYTKYVRSGRTHIVLPTTGGGSSLDGPFFGQFDELALVTMAREGPRIANLLLDGVMDEDVRTQESAAQRGAVRRGVRVRAKPVILKGPVTGMHKTALALSNETDLVMRVVVDMPGSPCIAVAPALLAFDLKPGATQTAQVNLDVVRPVPVDSLPPAAVSWSASFTPPGFGPTTMTGAAAIGIDTTYVVSRVTKRVTVDGDLGEWRRLPLRAALAERITYPQNWDGPADGSYDFAVACDSSYLYLAVRATDDELLVDRSEFPWEQDALAIMLDARKRSERGTEVGVDGQFKAYLLFYLSPGRKGAMVWYRQDLLPQGCLAACVPTAKGYDTEIAVPLSYLRERQGARWDSFRVNLTMNDRDTRGTAAIHWRPDWNSSDDYEGSGTFVRSDARTH
jgi:hypothetical protein